MKFIIYSARNFKDSLKSYLPIIKKLNILEEYIQVLDNNETYGTDIAIIKLDTIEELIKLKKALCQDLILELNEFYYDAMMCYKGGTYEKIKDIPCELIIYDSYIE